MDIAPSAQSYIHGAVVVHIPSEKSLVGDPGVGWRVAMGIASLGVSEGVLHSVSEDTKAYSEIPCRVKN